MYKPQSHYKYHILRPEKRLILWNHFSNSVQFRNYTWYHVSLLNNSQEEKKGEKSKTAHLKYLNINMNKVVFGQSFWYFSIFTRYLQM